MGLGLRVSEVFLHQRGSLFGWLPVGMATGVALFFAMRFEPGVAQIALVAAGGVWAALAAWRLDERVSPLPVFVAMVALGFVVAGVRAHQVAGPVLDWRYYGAVEGRIVGMDRSGSDAVRLTLDRVKLDRVAPFETPTRVRISLHGDADLGVAPEPGLRVMTTAHLGPPGGPVEPGGFDFQRHAWFARLGAVGYTRVPLVAISAAEFDLRQTVFRIRMTASARVRAALPGDVGGFAAAVTTGDRSGISQDGLDDLRASNTAHLLAISGLHMGLLSGFVFGLLRLIFALIPVVALSWPARKLAAAGALVAASVYLALSGGNVATERAFIMVAVALCAIMVNRRALSLRAVAIAAMIVLLLRPEALMGPGFQMSFAATTALVAVFGWMRDAQWTPGPRWIQPAMGVVISSAVAGLATSPIGAAHFNTMAHYGIFANLASVPLMGAIVIPAAVLALALAPFGAEIVGLWIMGLGLQWILWVADFVSGLEGARGYVTGPQPWVLPVMALGALFVILWQGRARWAGTAVIAAALLGWQVGDRPAVLVADTGGLVGVMTPEGRALSKPKGAGFVARNWLENDGDGVDQAQAAARWSGGDVTGLRVVHLTGKRAAAAFDGCAPGEVVVTNAKLPAIRDLPCLVLDPATLRKTGAVAVVAQGDQLRLVTARAVAGDRMWSGWARHAAPDLKLGPLTETLAAQALRP
ncbi:ComEC/Rec2 family competence protein [uncultured Tateyamaria sp.]|uniref:ComEC/Rec2 family competence protein n=1 Tax=uncultured Tateyamaria sp. TaxID=455651 RepID=UPI002610937D|nr:ComEC/Rec2 family competence protein [uncultured Tateyamaria sp.]